MQYRPEIDGLRALAVVPVILFHAGFETFAGGFVGVDVFFVISGYLITTIILAELRDGTFSIMNFYERRARRILPALYLIMASSVPFAVAWMMQQDLKDFAQSLVAVSVFSSNILFWLESDYFDTATELKPMLHTWSLAVEEQYYIFFPAFLMATWRLGTRWVIGLLVLIFLASFLLGQWGAYNAPTAAFYLLPTRGWELLIGAFAAFYFYQYGAPVGARKWNDAFSFGGLLLILVSVFAYSHATPFPSFYTLLPTVGALLIILFAQTGTVAARLLSTKLFVGIGLISYSAYLWHQPLFAFTRYRSPTEPPEIAMALLCLLVLPLSYLSWRFVETPFRNKSRFGRNVVFSSSVAGGLAFAVSGTILMQKPGSFARAAQYEVSVRSFETKPCDIDENLSRYCRIIGDTRNSPSIVLWGDSHAQALAPGLHDMLKERQKSAIRLSFGGCTPIPKVALSYEYFEDCLDFSHAVLAALQKDPDLTTVVLSSRWTAHFEGSGYDNNEGGVEIFNDDNRLHTELDNGEYGFDAQRIEQRYLDLLAELSDKKVILVLPVPEAGWHVPRYLSNHGLSGDYDDTGFPAHLGATSAERYLERNERVRKLLTAATTGVQFVDPFDLFCTTVEHEGDRRCITHDDGFPLYFDDDHLSYAGSVKVAAEILDLLD